MTSLGPPGLPPVTTIDPSQLKEFSREDLQEYLKHFRIVPASTKPLMKHQMTDVIRSFAQYGELRPEAIAEACLKAGSKRMYSPSDDGDAAAGRGGASSSTPRAATRNVQHFDSFGLHSTGLSAAHGLSSVGSAADVSSSALASMPLPYKIVGTAQKTKSWRARANAKKQADNGIEMCHDCHVRRGNLACQGVRCRACCFIAMNKDSTIFCAEHQKDVARLKREGREDLLTPGAVRAAQNAASAGTEHATASSATALRRRRLTRRDSSWRQAAAQRAESEPDVVPPRQLTHPMAASVKTLLTSSAEPIVSALGGAVGWFADADNACGPTPLFDASAHSSVGAGVVPCPSCRRPVVTSGDNFWRHVLVCDEAHAAAYMRVALQRAREHGGSSLSSAAALVRPPHEQILRAVNTQHASAGSSDRRHKRAAAAVSHTDDDDNDNHQHGDNNNNSSRERLAAAIEVAACVGPLDVAQARGAKRLKTVHSALRQLLTSPPPASPSAASLSASVHHLHTRFTSAAVTPSLSTIEQTLINSQNASKQYIEAVHAIDQCSTVEQIDKLRSNLLNQK